MIDIKAEQNQQQQFVNPTSTSAPPAYATAQVHQPESYPLQRIHQQSPSLRSPPQTTDYFPRSQPFSSPYAQSPPANTPQPQVIPSAITVGHEYQQQLFARCARGEHDTTTKYGICGIICAVLLFPFGLICLFTDVEKRCVRCGVKVD